MLDARRHRELDLIAALIALQRIGEHTEVVCATADQVLDQVGSFFGTDLTAIQRFPLSIRSIFDGVEFDEVDTIEWMFPRNEESVGDFSDGEVTRLTGLGTCCFFGGVFCVVEGNHEKIGNCMLRSVEKVA